MYKNNDRRRFFRITDEIGISYEIIPDGFSTEVQDVRDTQREEMDFKFLLGQHNEFVNKALTELSKQQPQAANAIEAVNKKLDVLLQFFELDNLSLKHNFQHIDEVNISACGVAFPVKELINSGTKVNLTLYLPPDNTVVKALGNTVDCLSMDDNSYYLRMEFVDMGESDREHLIQHIVQRQRILLRSLRDEMDGTY